MLSAHDKTSSPLWQRAVKRMLDIGISATGLLLLLPILIIIAVVVKLTSRGPAIYAQERIGYKRKKFLMYKFRSMYVDAEPHGPRLADIHDARITSFGHILRIWKLDELPQLWNVLVGEMSIVGPRPEREFYICQLERDQQPFEDLLLVKPGITSLGMIRYGYAGSLDEMAERMKHDLEYIDNQSLVLDLKIMLGTVRVIVRRQVNRKDNGRTLHSISY